MNPKESPMPDLQELIATYPRIFKGEPPVIPGYVNAGWHPPLMRLCAGIDALLTDQEAEQCEVMQIKEKFGGLRFYVRLGQAERISMDISSPDGERVRLEALCVDAEPDTLARIHLLIREAEAEAARTCEDCGELGKLRRDSWSRTLCDGHWVRHQRRHDDDGEGCNT